MHSKQELPKARRALREHRFRMGKFVSNSCFSSKSGGLFVIFLSASFFHRLLAPLCGSCAYSEQLPSYLRCAVSFFTGSLALRRVGAPRPNPPPERLSLSGLCKTLRAKYSTFSVLKQSAVLLAFLSLIFYNIPGSLPCFLCPGTACRTATHLEKALDVLPSK